MDSKHQTLQPNPEIEVGEFTIQQLKNGSFWIEREDGEGGEFSLEELEECIANFYKEKF